MSLSDFLLARIAEDERVLDGRERMGNPPGIRWETWQATMRRDRAECEAKRRIVEDHAPTSTAHDRYCREDGSTSSEPVASGEPACLQCTDSTQDWRVTAYWDESNRVVAPCDTARYLAAIYSDHPDYDEAWRP